jgi:hypothetical protein
MLRPTHNVIPAQAGIQRQVHDLSVRHPHTIHGQSTSPSAASPRPSGERVAQPGAKATWRSWVRGAVSRLHRSARDALRADPASGACSTPHPANAFSKPGIASALSPEGARGRQIRWGMGGDFYPCFHPATSPADARFPGPLRRSPQLHFARFIAVVSSRCNLPSLRRSQERTRERSGGGAGPGGGRVASHQVDIAGCRGGAILPPGSGASVGPSMAPPEGNGGRWIVPRSRRLRASWSS